MARDASVGGQAHATRCFVILRVAAFSSSQDRPPRVRWRREYWDPFGQGRLVSHLRVLVHVIVALDSEMTDDHPRSPAEEN